MMDKKMNVVSPRNPLKYPFQDEISMLQLKQTLEAIYPNLKMILQVGRNTVTLEIRDEKNQIPVRDLAVKMANAIGTQVYTSKNKRNKCQLLQHVIETITNHNIRLIVQTNKTCIKNGKYTRCVEQNGRRTRGIEKCEDQKSLCGKTPQFETNKPEKSVETELV